MLKNEEIRQKYPFSRIGLNYFEAEWITCGCMCTVRKEEWKDYCDFVDIEYQKLISRSVTRWLLLYRSLSVQFSLFMHSDQAQNTWSGIQGQEATAVAVKDASILPSFNFILHVHGHTNCCPETLFGNSLSEFCLY